MATIVVTGSSRGIGLAAALDLARAGHFVWAAMRNPAGSPELAATAAAEGLPLEVVAMDVDSDASVSEAFARIHAKGPVGVLVNNAGIERTGSIEETPLQDFRTCMETNYFGVLRCIQAVVASMRERRSGCIVTITSVAGKISAAPMGPYAASKWAIEGAMEALAQEMKSFGVRVAMVEPGIVDTRMARNVENQNPNRYYPHAARFKALFAAALSQPVPPSVVAEKVREVIESGTWTLRHPAGPDAAPFLAWRAAMTDEQWADLGALDDESWYARIQADFGMDARPRSA